MRSVCNVEAGHIFHVIDAVIEQLDLVWWDETTFILVIFFPLVFWWWWGASSYTLAPNLPHVSIWTESSSESLNGLFSLCISDVFTFVTCLNVHFWAAATALSDCSLALSLTAVLTTATAAQPNRKCTGCCLRLSTKMISIQVKSLKDKRNILWHVHTVISHPPNHWIHTVVCEYNCHMLLYHHLLEKGCHN